VLVGLRFSAITQGIPHATHSSRYDNLGRVSIGAPAFISMDPFEHAQISGAEYDEWRNDNGYVAFEGIRRTAEFLQTFIKYPPSQSPASFSIDQIVEGIEKKIEQMQQLQRQ
jgi:hypothetical protein